MNTKHIDEFRTIYFKAGLKRKSLDPLATFIESKFGIEVGIGYDFLNLYTEEPELVTRIVRSIKRWTAVDPTIQIDEVCE